MSETDMDVEAELRALMEVNASNHSDQVSSTESDVLIGSAHGEHSSVPAPRREQNPSAQDRNTPVEGAVSAHGVLSEHSREHSQGFDEHSVLITDGVEIPVHGTNVDASGGVEPATEAAATPQQEPTQNTDEGEAVGVTEEEESGPQEVASRGARAIAWARKEATDAVNDMCRGDAWNQGVSPVKGTVSYTNEAGWTGNGRILRGLAQGYNWTVSIPGQYVFLTAAKTVRRPARFFIALGFLWLTTATVLAIVPNNPLFDLAAHLLRAAADQLTN